MDLTANLEAIEKRIAAACDRSGRPRSAVQLLAVTKTHPPETIHAAVAAGLSHFGENKVQEAKAKIPHCPGRIHWHFIGHLQSNKCRDAVAVFETVQSVDSLAVARELNKRAEQAARTLPVLLEVNVAGEGSKFGYAPEQLLADLPGLNTLSRLELHGLMAVPPYAAQPESVRPYFRRLRELKQRCEQVLGAPLSQLSMGMSGDFEVAIEEGSTIIRLGTALFGPRAHVRRVAG